MRIAQGFYQDDETGEVVTFNVDSETGEPVVEHNLLAELAEAAATNQPASTTGESGKYSKFPKGYATKSRKFQVLKENIMAGANPTSYRMLLLLPTLLFCPGVLCILLMILEIFLHVRCHKKNKKLSDPNLFYRSPFHAVTSIFCGVCRDCTTASKIGHMQDKRRFHYDYVQRLTMLCD